ncbi:hypothetical protein U6A24_17540 [Aquimarina gracilis]|uniref:Bacteriocin-like protein n=1 Tax=Aquimarina gracilis TaxID=874422 RepID=A0ABU5ZZM9_9FLAO|nr:hypothetical protein [Aquimarina gracilis]MEB3347283.1 hypothetical protein [Aquimarina gracilis]
MKKSLKSLKLKKEVITKFEQETIKGGCPVHGGGPGNTFFCITNGPLNTCPPPGVQCY